MNVEQTLGLEHKIELFRLRGEKEAQFRTIEDLLFSITLSRSLLSAENKPEIIGEIIAKDIFTYLNPEYVFVDIFGDEMGAEGTKTKTSTYNIFELVDNKGVEYGRLEIGLKSIDNVCVIRKIPIIKATLPIIINRLRLYKEYIDIQELTTIDSKTQLSNYRRVKRVLEQFHEDKLPYSVVFFDIDDFKKINSQFGEHRTDYILVQIAKLMKNDFKQPNIRARFGGDEFYVIFPNKDIDSVYAMFYQFMEKIRAHNFEIHNFDGVVNLKISAGGTDYVLERDDGKINGWRDILDRANDAEFYSKINGKNRFSVYEESMKRD